MATLLKHAEQNFDDCILVVMAPLSRYEITNIFNKQFFIYITRMKVLKEYIFPHIRKINRPLPSLLRQIKSQSPANIYTHTHTAAFKTRYTEKRLFRIDSDVSRID